MNKQVPTRYLVLVLLALFCLPCGLYCHGNAESATPSQGITHDEADCFRAMELVAEQEGWSDATLYRVIEDECRR